MKKLICIVVIFLLINHDQAWAQSYTGKVVGIADGDTFTLLTANKEQKKIRLAEIDTPEKAQPYGQRSRQTLSELIFNKEVRAEQTDLDRYGRIVARVYQGNTDINAEMIRQGAAWVYRQYAKDQKLYAMEAEAKAAQKGLWSLPKAQQIPPWEWRRVGVKAEEPVKIATPTKEEFKCGSKRYCKEMSSCEEAKYYLEHCGLSRLDGNGDGVPCESLCK